jgi:uncharacterized membrane protein
VQFLETYFIFFTIFLIFGENDIKIKETKEARSSLDLHAIEALFFNIISLLVLMLEIFGAIIIAFSGAGIFLHFLRTSRDGRDVRLTFARYLVFGLEFKLAGEILRTVVVRTINEVILLGSIIFLRAILNFVVHWEIRQEKQDRDD